MDSAAADCRILSCSATLIPVSAPLRIGYRPPGPSVHEVVSVAESVVEGGLG
jgi:hypothetical protein